MDFSKIIINKELPIGKYEEEIIEKFEKSSNMIIIGETGSGKTTQIPLILAKSMSKYQDLDEGKIAITQPRRVAATSVSQYVASLMGEELGHSVGYKIRFNENVSDETKIIFMTDGIMLREAQLDPLLSQYSVIMVDEAHERNINSDFLIGLLVDIQKKRKDRGMIPLKIIVASATLEKDKFEDFFFAIPEETLSVIEVPGRLFPIKAYFEEKEVLGYEEAAAEKVMQICQETKKGDILIFMPGKREIEKTKKYIEEFNTYEHFPLDIITIHANLPIEEQHKIFNHTEKRKVVIATNIAETSLTVPGIIFVIDSGLVKQMDFNPHTGINSLITKHHAIKGLEQRKGRAGRIEPGFYYALYTQASLKERDEFTKPEILRTSLSQVILIMKKIGIDDIDSFMFVDTPDMNLIHNAIRELQWLGALDNTEKLTEKGSHMAHLPLEPRLANLVIEAQKHHCVESICTLSAFLELKPVILFYTLDDFIKKIEEGEIDPDPNLDTYALAVKLHKDYQKKVIRFEHFGSDFFTILKIWDLWIKNNYDPTWATNNYLSAEVIQEGTNIREELLDIVSKSGYEPFDKPGGDLYLRIEKTLLSAFKSNILFRQRNGMYKRLRSNEDGIRIHNSSVLLNAKPLYAVAFEVIEINEIDSAPKLSAKFLHGIDESLLWQLYPKLVKRVNKRDRTFNNFNEGRRRKRFNKNKFPRNRGKR